MTNIDTTAHGALHIDRQATKSNPMAALLEDEAAVKGLEELVSKVAPLLAGGRLNRLVDLASVTADMVDMTDAYMVEKLAKAFEDMSGALWTTGNAARMARAQVEDMQELPSMMGLVRLAREPDVRRGLAFFLALAGVVGKGMSTPPLDGTSD